MTEHLLQAAKHKGNLASRLILRSFHMSRGYPPVQSTFLKYAGSLSHEKITKEDLSAASDICFEAAKKFLFNGGHVRFLTKDFQDEPENMIYQQVDAAVANLLAGLNSARTYEVDGAAPLQIMTADSDWMPYSKSRESEISRLTTVTSFKSNFVEYVLIGRDSGMTELNDFYRGSREKFEGMASRGALEGFMGYQLQNLVAAHLSYNPGDTVPLADAAHEAQVRMSALEQ